MNEFSAPPDVSAVKRRADAAEVRLDCLYRWYLILDPYLFIFGPLLPQSSSQLHDWKGAAGASWGAFCLTNNIFPLGRFVTPYAAPIWHTILCAALSGCTRTSYTPGPLDVWLRVATLSSLVYGKYECSPYRMDLGAT